MVDAIGGRTIPGGVSPVTRVADVQAAKAATATAQPTANAAPATLGAVAREMASSAPVDTDRVSRIKRAITEGRFPISPTTIADQMIALRLDWISKDSRA